MSKVLKKFTAYDLIIITLISGISIASKSVFILLGEILAGSVFPAGTFSGVMYMIWIVLPALIVKKRGTVLLTGILQAVLALLFGCLGNRGLLNIPVYVVPCIAVEMVMFIFSDYISSWLTSFLTGSVTNMTGALIVGVIYFQFSLVPLLISLSIAFVTGGLGGIIAYKFYISILKHFVQTKIYSEENKNDIGK